MDRSPEEHVEAQSSKLFDLADQCERLADEGGDLATALWLKDVAKEMRAKARGDLTNVAQSDARRREDQ